MKTVLQYDEEKDVFKPKPSVLQLFHLEKSQTPSEDITGQKAKLQLTGQEKEMGSVMVDLAKYAKDRESSEKLYLSDMQDMYIEIAVSSKPMDAVVPSQPQPPEQKSQLLSQKTSLLPTGTQQPPLRRMQTKTEPLTEEDFQLVREYKEREDGYRNKIKELENTRSKLQNINLEVQQDWQKLQMQGSELERVERRHAEMAFILREKDKTICQEYAEIINKL